MPNKRRMLRQFHDITSMVVLMTEQLFAGLVSSRFCGVWIDEDPIPDGFYGTDISVRRSLTLEIITHHVDMHPQARESFLPQTSNLTN
jgi:hypothetical protein